RQLRNRRRVAAEAERLTARLAAGRAGMRFLGLDPGLTATGWGVVESRGNELVHVADGAVKPDSSAPIGVRLRALHEGLARIIAQYAPDEAAVEETFVNRNAASALRLGQARGV